MMKNTLPRNIAVIKWSSVGLYFDDWSPGDGVTRYRFFTKPDQDYFAGDGLYTALGWKEACIFADGFLTAVSTRNFRSDSNVS